MFNFFSNHSRHTTEMCKCLKYYFYLTIWYYYWIIEGLEQPQTDRYKPIQLKTPKHRSLTKPYRPNTYYNGHIQNRLLSYTTQATWKQDSALRDVHNHETNPQAIHNCKTKPESYFPNSETTFSYLIILSHPCLLPHKRPLGSSYPLTMSHQY